MKYYLSIDSGGTKTAFLLVNEFGEELTSFNLGPANYIVNGLDNVINTYKDGLNKIEDDLKIKSSNISHSFIAMAGYGDIPKDNEMINKKIKENFDFNFAIGNDTENALSGSLMGESGIHIIAGTGSIGIGRDLNNNLSRSGGWHHAFGGDEGSGYWIGCHLIQHFTKQADGREEKTYLFNYLINKYNLECPENILDLVINKWDMQRDKIASLSKDVSYCASVGDKTAISIFNEAAKELALIINAIHSMGLYDDTTKISYSGGVFKCLDYFKDTFTNSLNFKYELVTPKFNPLVGGAILALQNDGLKINETITKNLEKIE